MMKTGGELRSDRHRERGAAMVELALVLPLLLMILMGIVEFGRLYNAQIAVQGAAREGARSLALGKDHATVRAAVKAAAPNVIIVDSDITPTVPTNSATHTCPTTGDATATVEVIVGHTISIPFFKIGNTRVKAKAAMRCGV